MGAVDFAVPVGRGLPAAADRAVGDGGFVSDRVAQENTRLKVDGLFQFSRNPMYLGVFATILARLLYTLNPVVLLAGVFVVAVHHRIVLAEEQHLQKAFGQEYADYCRRVRRYL